MTTPIAAPLVPLGPELAPGKAEPTAMDGFAALLGQLVAVVAGGPSGQPAQGVAPEESQPPAVPELLPDGAVAAAVASAVAPASWAALRPDAQGSLTPALATGEPAAPEPRPDLGLPATATPTARAAVLRHGPVATPPGQAAKPGDEPAPAVFAAMAERAALPAPLHPTPARPALSPDLTSGDPAAPSRTGPPSDVPVPTTPVEAALAPAAPAPLPPTASAQAVERTESVRPAIVEAARGLRQEGDGRVSLVVRLNPPELGSVLVKLTVQDGRVDVQLRTPDLQAVGDLTAQSREVQQVLKDAGFDLSSFDVSHGGVDHERGEGKTPDRGTTQRDRPADGRDAALPVTDDVPEARPAGTWL